MLQFSVFSGHTELIQNKTCRFVEMLWSLVCQTSEQRILIKPTYLIFNNVLPQCSPKVKKTKLLIWETFYFKMTLSASILFKDMVFRFFTFKTIMFCIYNLMWQPLSYHLNAQKIYALYFFFLYFCIIVHMSKAKLLLEAQYVLYLLDYASLHVMCIFTRAPKRVFFSPLKFFLDIYQTNRAISAKFVVPIRPSILHPICRYKFRTYHRLATNDVRVTSVTLTISTVWLSLWRYRIFKVVKTKNLLDK